MGGPENETSAEGETKDLKLLLGNKRIHLFSSISEYVITKKLLSLLYFHHSYVGRI